MANRLARNVSAGFLNRVWTLALGLAFVPFQVHYLGVDGYGALAFLLTLQSLLAVFDLGLSYSITRALADVRGEVAAVPRQRGAIKAFETVYWGIAIVVSLAMVAGAQPLAAWINDDASGSRSMATAVALFAGIQLVQWPAAIYASGLAGLERQVSVATLNSVFATLRVGGGIAVLAVASRPLEALLVWWLVVAAGNTVSLRAWLLACVPRNAGGSVRADWRRLAHYRKYAAGVTVTIVLSVLLAQSDRLVLSRLLSLADFGCYSLAAAACGVFVGLPNVITATFFPRFARLASQGDDAGIRLEYATATAFIAAVTVPPALMFAFFPAEILGLWIRDAGIATRTAPLLALLALAGAASAPGMLAFTLEAASGRNRRVVIQMACLCVAAWGTFVLIGRSHGALGVCVAWLGIYAVQIAILVPSIVVRSAGLDWRRWAMSAIGAPLLGGLPVVALARWGFPGTRSPWAVFGSLAFVGTLVTLGVALATPELRNLLRKVASRGRPA